MVVIMSYRSSGCVLISEISQSAIWRLMTPARTCIYLCCLTGTSTLRSSVPVVLVSGWKWTWSRLNQVWLFPVLGPCTGLAAQPGSIILKNHRAGPSSYWAGPVSIRCHSRRKVHRLAHSNASAVRILPLHGCTCLFSSPVGVNCL